MVEGYYTIIPGRHYNIIIKFNITSFDEISVDTAIVRKTEKSDFLSRQ